MKNGKYLTSQFLNKISADGQLNIENLIILFCAIFIASIGLNMNSTATIIGAMLISPLMGPLLAIGTGLAVYNTQILKKGFISLLAEIGISLVASTAYFYFSPLSYASQEIIARTSPTIWDVLIAFFGGVAGIVGARKKGATNVVAGVAIATALMPPLCTVGYSIAAKNFEYFMGSSYLFLINCVFITLTAFLGVKIMKWLNYSQHRKETNFFRKPTLKEVLLAVLVIILIIPSILSAHQMVQSSILEQNVKQLITKEFTNINLVKESVNSDARTINLIISGKKIEPSHLKDIKNNLAKYHLNGYSLNVMQVPQVNQNNNLSEQIDSAIAAHEQAKQKQNEQLQEKQEKNNQEIKNLSKQINSVTMATDNHGKQIIIIELKEKIPGKKKHSLVQKVKVKFPKISTVRIIYQNDHE